MKKILTVILSIKGYSDNTFRPNDNVTRAEFVAMTVRFDALFNGVKNTPMLQQIIGHIPMLPTQNTQAGSTAMLTAHLRAITLLQEQKL